MKRFIPLDILRGLSIFGMVFSALVPPAVLPAFMYHIQNPPPDHALNVNVYGISWVDLVFPIFIFCMGVAIPLSFHARWAGAGQKDGRPDRAQRRKDLCHIGKRFLMLWAFSYLCIILQASGVSLAEGPGLFWKNYLLQGLILLGFAALTLIYRRRKSPVFLSVAGWILALALSLVFHFVYGLEITLFKRSIILLLLAFLYLFGSLIWYFTRKSRWWQGAAFLLAAGISLLSRRSGFDAILYANRSLSWALNMESINFLMILLPATWVGDSIRARSGAIEANEKPHASGRLAARAGLLWVVYLLFILYKPRYGSLQNPLRILICCLYGLWLWLLYRRERNPLAPVSALGSLLIVSSLIIAPYEGITKVPCTFSYCFASGGIAVLLLLFLVHVFKKDRCRFLGGILAGAGANPLMSYVAYGMLILPLMELTRFIKIYDWAYPRQWPWAGVLRAFIVVLFTLFAVSRFTRKGLYWKI